jgi:hypothetical protein
MRTISQPEQLLMSTNISAEIHIEDPRNHPPEIVSTLRGLFTAGVSRIPDPKRAHFYEVRNEALVYYVYISPANGKVLLLATWPP